MEKRIKFKFNNELCIGYIEDKSDEIIEALREDNPISNHEMMAVLCLLLLADFSYEEDYTIIEADPISGSN